MLSGLRPSSFSTVSITLAVSGLVKPRFDMKVARSSSVLATIVWRAALMPWMNPAGEESAKLRSAGAASWMNRLAASLL